MTNQTNDDLKTSWRSAVAYLNLLIENIRLLSTEKLTILMSKGALVGVLAIFGIIAFFFISIGLVFLLGEVISVMWAFMIMGGVYILLALLALVFSKQLFVDPMARFLSRLFLQVVEGIYFRGHSI